MRTKRIFILFVCQIILIASRAWSQPIKITVSYAADTPANLQVFTAKEAGIFTKNGLDVQLVRIAGNVAVMALIAGELPINGQVGGSVIISSNLAGSDAVMIAAGVVASDYVLVSRPEIKSVKQLKGGVLGVSSLSGSSMLSTHFALKKLGLDPNKDVSIVVIGQASERFVSLRTGRIRATLLTPPQWIIAEREGFNTLTDVAELPFPYSTVATTRRFIRDSPDIVRRYVKSQIDAVHLMKVDHETGMKILAKYLNQRLDEKILQRTYAQTIADNVLPRKQYPDTAGIKTVLEMIGDQKAARAKPEQFADVRFVKEFDDSGYIDNLYK